MRFSLPTFALGRPVTVLMISISMLILGGIAWFRLPLTFLPDIDEPFVGLMVPYPGGSPEQVEQQIAKPVEGELRTIPGLRRIRTISDSDGVFASMLFDLDVEMTTATAEIRDRMERLKLVLPEEADRMMLQRFSSRSIPVMAVGFFRDGNEEEFVHLLRTVALPRLQRLDGVANVNILTPIQEREILIEFDQNNLQSMNLGLAQLVATLQASSLNVSVGDLQDGEQRFFVRAMGEYRRIEDIENIVVAPAGLRLKDVAEIRFAARGDVAHVTLDGQAGAVALIVKESEANTVDTCDYVLAELPNILALLDKQGSSEKVVHRIFFDQSELIRSALNNLFMQGIYGGIMALTVLFMFLHRFRPTVIVAFAIPTSLLVALVFMFFWGMELNLVTMVSMIIAVGMLVDNAIVVVENIIRHRSLGFDRFESSRRGATEVGLAIFASTTTTWVVFVPMYYLEAGRMSIFMEQLGMPLIVSLGGSLVIALTLIPLAMSRMKESEDTSLFERLEQRLGLLPPGDGDEAPPSTGVLGFLGRLNLIQRIINGYGFILGTALRFKLVSFVILGLLIWVTYAVPFQQVGMRDLPKLDTREVKINIETEQNVDMKETERLFGLLESQLDSRREELGIKNIMSFYEVGGGVLEMYLFTEEDGPEWETPQYDTEEVMRILSESLPDMVPGGELQFTVTETGTSGDSKAVSLTMRGDDTTELERYAEQFKKIIAGIDNVRDVTTDLEKSKREVQIEIDEALAERRGITPYNIATTVDAALRGARLPFMKQGGREIPVWAQFREEDRTSRANLDNVTVMGASGDLVPLHELVEYSKEQSPASIMRVDGKNTITLSANADTDDLASIMADLSEAAENFELPVGYTIGFGDALQELGENAFQFSTTLLMAVILIYLVMSALFESLLYPLSILSTVPLALGGAYWALLITGTPLDSVTMIGCILMAGLIVNNGIVIVDHINTLRKRFPSREAAIVEAGSHRFRPVMMTAITTILGVVPLAMAKTGGAATFAGLGRALIGGLTVGTILTLFVVPLFYCLLDDLQRWLVNFLGALIHGGKVSKKAAEPQ